VDADPELDAAFGRQAGVALHEATLNLDGTADRFNHTPEFNDNTVAGSFDDPAAVNGDRWINQVAAERPQAREDPILIRSCEPTESHDVRDQDRCDFAGLAHSALGHRAE
jgi:hypothetical protein